MKRTQPYSSGRLKVFLPSSIGQILSKFYLTKFYIQKIIFCQFT